MPPRFAHGCEGSISPDGPSGLCSFIALPRPYPHLPGGAVRPCREPPGVAIRGDKLYQLTFSGRNWKFSNGGYTLIP